MQPTDPISIVMSVQEWNNVLQLLAEQPFKLSAPLIQRIQQQCQVAEQQPQPGMPATNGSAVASN
jgi:hypothetical protein